eukprot:8793776-Alexandrium_andersonii.AAC.1
MYSHGNLSLQTAPCCSADFYTGVRRSTSSAFGSSSNSQPPKAREVRGTRNSPEGWRRASRLLE